MKVGIITYDFYPFEGGIGRHIYELYKKLTENYGIDIVVFSPNKNSIKNHVNIFGLSKKIGKNIMFSFLVNMINNNLINKYDLDLVHFHGGPGGIIFIKKVKDTPVIFTVHHTYYQQYYLIPEQKWKYIFSKFENISYKFADKIICVSENTRDILVKNYHIEKEKIEIIPNGVDINKFRPLNNIEKIRNSILFVGRLDERKGIKYLIKSIVLVKEMIPDIKLFIVGTGKLKKELEKFIILNNIKQNVKFLGRLSDKDLVEWYNRCEIVVIPSIFEGFGIVAIEAMACKTPIIATNVPGLNSIIKNGENGLLVPPKDSRKLADAIVNLLNDCKLRRHLSVNGRKEVLKKFNWDIIAKRTVKIYEEVIK